MDIMVSRVEERDCVDFIRGRLRGCMGCGWKGWNLDQWDGGGWLKRPVEGYGRTLMLPKYVGRNDFVEEISVTSLGQWVTCGVVLDIDAYPTRPLWARTILPLKCTWLKSAGSRVGMVGIVG